MRELELEDEFELLVNPGVPIGPAISALTGLRDSELRGQPQPAVAEGNDSDPAHHDHVCRLRQADQDPADRA